MRLRIFRRRWGLSLIAVPLALAALAFRAPPPVSVPPVAAVVPPATPTSAPTVLVPSSTPTAPLPTSTLATSALPTSPPTSAPPTSPTPSAVSTPTPRPAGTRPHVGIQVGHWKANELPDELARLRTSSGAFAAGYTEAEVNLDIARRVAALLESDGITVDVLPATIPPAYDADVFVALHADGSSNAGARGFKLATPWRTSRASQHLLDAITAEYAASTGLPQDGAITFNMRGYYAFSNRRHQHAIARTTPGVIVEMGFLTSAADRALLIGQPDAVAVGIANGIVRYLNERDPLDGAALLPPDFKVQRPIAEAGLVVRAAPRDDAAPLLDLKASDRLIPFQERDGWYQIVVRSKPQIVGWVRKDQVTATDDPTPTPPPATDS